MSCCRRDQFTLDSTEMPQGAGSGIIWDDEGHVVTNLHVRSRAGHCFKSSAACTPTAVGMWTARLSSQIIEVR